MNGKFQIGRWRVDPGLNSLSFNGTTARVEPKVMEVLVCLASQPGEAIPKETILKTVWPETFVSDDVLIRSISELRRVFEDDAREPRFIETIPKRGYRLIAPVERINGLVAAHPDSTQPVDRLANDPSRRLPWRVAATVSVSCLLLIPVLLLLNVAGLGDRLRGNRNPTIRSLAVLPLQSLADDPRQEYFAEGVTDALITDLAQISALKVVSRTSIMRYGKPDKPLSQIARELGVDGIVEGTVQRSGDRVRITAQLIYGPADQHLWANSFERDVKDVLDLQSAVANEIASQIRVKVTPEEQARFSSPRPVNPKALDAYVEARFHIDRAENLEYYNGKQEEQRDELRKAISYLDLATQEDPTYVPADVAYFDAIDAANTSQLELVSRAKTAVAKALELDGSSEAAHSALGRMLMQFDYDWAGAETEYRKAIQFNPRSGDAHYQYSEYLLNVGRNAEGDKELNLAQALDPAHDYLGSNTGERPGWTLEQQRQVLEEQNPNNPFVLAVMAKNYAIAGRFKESVEMWERCLTLYGWQNFANVLKQADAKGGPRFALEEWMREGERYEKKHGGQPLEGMAFTYSSLGNNDRAFSWLEKAVERRHWMIIYLKRDKVWDPLRSDPRFAALLHRVGLPQ